VIEDKMDLCKRTNATIKAILEQEAKLRLSSQASNDERRKET